MTFHPKDPAVIFRKAILKNWIALTFTVILGGGLLGFLVFKINTAVKTITALSGERKWISVSLDRLARLSQDHARANELMYLLESGLPSTLDIPTIVVPLVKRLGEENDVRASLEVKTANPSDGSLGSVEILLRADGSKDNLTAFLKALESKQVSFHFDSLKLALLGGTGLDQLQLSGRIYTR